MSWIFKKRDQGRGPHINEDLKTRTEKRRSWRELFLPSESQTRRVEENLKLVDSPPTERRRSAPPTAEPANSTPPGVPSSRDVSLITAPKDPDRSDRDDGGYESKSPVPTLGLPVCLLQPLSVMGPEMAVSDIVVPKTLAPETVTPKGVTTETSAPTQALVVEESHKDSLSARNTYPLKHPVYSSATLHKVTAVHENEPASDSGRDFFDLDVAELPNMLGAHGTEAGSVTPTYFLQLPLADSSGPMDDTVLPPQRQAEEIKNLRLLQCEPERLGLRTLHIGSTIDRLARLSKIYPEITESRRKSIIDSSLPDELYDVIFSKFLTVPSSHGTEDDPRSLKTQIDALQKTLDVKGIWFDFSLVESRIQLGQLLWSAVEASPDPTTPNMDGEPPSERDVTLLQITLACELLLRLDAVAATSRGKVVDSARNADVTIKDFHNRATPKVKWDLVLAQIFLKNVLVKAGVKKSLKRDYLLRIPKRLFFPASSSLVTPPEEYEHLPDALLLPRHQERQLDGLVHFAHSIGWPNVDELEVHLKQQFPPLELKRPTLHQRSSLLMHRSTSLFQRSPATPIAEATDYFAAKPIRNSHESGRPTFRPRLSRILTKQRSYLLQSPTPAHVERPSYSSGEVSSPPLDMGQHQQQPCGWLTRAYLTSLILPGEALQHHLVSALLENSPGALSCLGETATLYGGLVYAERSYWSRASIVGRVLACMPDSMEGWGWVGTNVVPMVRWNGDKDAKWKSEGWVDVDACGVPGQQTSTKNKDARVIRQSERIDRHLDPLSHQDMTDSKPEDFVLPIDAEGKPSSALWFEGLKLERQQQPDTIVAHLGGAASDDVSPSPASYMAFMTFSSMSLSSEIGSPNIPLRYDVQFISAVPCAIPLPSALAETGLVKGQDANVLNRMRHDLHVGYRFRIVPAGDVLKKSFRHSIAGPIEAGIADGGELLVLDCRGSVELELLARSWCASMGKHAVLGRVGTTCLACCVREARGMDVDVMLRLG